MRDFQQKTKISGQNRDWGIGIGEAFIPMGADQCVRPRGITFYHMHEYWMMQSRLE
jgi:hypothetical protein